MSCKTAEANAAAQRRFYRRRMDMALEVLGGECIVCGSTDELEFDHVDPSEKLFSISSGYKRRLDVFLAEVAKCELLCDRCHVRKTRAERRIGAFGHGTTSCYYNLKCRCALCREAYRIYRRQLRAAKLGMTLDDYVESLGPRGRKPYRRPGAVSPG